ncbi:uncharacterized protein LY89DRAFT_669340 [Mollisia scopiformis]|uniref:Uncharacterized protein n=1 Tax=Mollisia scopiformis TaxID=149040 RepID=A0A194X9U4_MOLSC|nr:uncharacterized protein LY89DRAFT_669340 [Mollisia scopiformis]KUJ16899.1 hypothetical protein LY89DRAFT_669340 [Mollisia scopiformis]
MTNTACVAYNEIVSWILNKAKDKYGIKDGVFTIGLTPPIGDLRGSLPWQREKAILLRKVTSKMIADKIIMPAAAAQDLTHGKSLSFQCHPEFVFTSTSVAQLKNHDWTTTFFKLCDDNLWVRGKMKSIEEFLDTMSAELASSKHSKTLASYVAKMTLPFQNEPALQGYQGYDMPQTRTSLTTKRKRVDMEGGNMAALPRKVDMGLTPKPRKTIDLSAGETSEGVRKSSTLTSEPPRSLLARFEAQDRKLQDLTTQVSEGLLANKSLMQQVRDQEATILQLKSAVERSKEGEEDVQERLQARVARLEQSIVDYGKWNEEWQAI